MNIEDPQIPSRRPLFVFALVLPLIFGLVGCASQGPLETLHEYRAALAADDPEAAWELLSPEVREQMSYDEFVENWDTYKQGFGDVDIAADGEVLLQAELEYTDYDQLKLHWADGGWRIVGGPFASFEQRTPRQALIGFVRAMEARNYDVIMRYVPTQYAQHMTSDSLADDIVKHQREIDDLVETLKTNLDNPIELRGDKAYMLYGSRRVVFVREDEAWKIDDPDEPHSAF